MSESQQNDLSWLPYGAPHGNTSQSWDDQRLDQNIPGPYPSGEQLIGFEAQPSYAAFHHGYDVYPDFVHSQGYPMSLADQVKHRRSRYGCFTCRSRRVKCDETHPVCERCRKSNRDCVYPKPQDALSSSQKETKVKAKADGDNTAIIESETKERKSSEPSDIPSLSESKSLSPSSQGSGEMPQIRSSRSKQVKDKPRSSNYKEIRSHSPLSAKHWINVVEDPNLQYYLDYHRTSISYHHYGFIRDDSDFIHSFIPSRALEYPPLLYALVAYSAYTHTMSKEEGAELKDFLPYYSQAMVRLRESLTHQAPDLNTLLTILQLALLEEFLGDWLNLFSHQQAAYKLLNTLFTPGTITVDQDHNKVLQWYIRFDLFGGFMAGRAPSLSREWFEAQVAFWDDLALHNPTRLGPKYEERNASMRLIGLDIAILFHRISQGLVSQDDLGREEADIRHRLALWHENFDPVLTDSGRAIRAVPRLDSSVPDHEDATAAEDEMLFYTGDVRTTNYVWANTWPMELMFDYQMAVAQQQTPSPDLTKRAIRILKLYEMIERVDFTPGRTLGAIAPLAVASIFLRKEPELIMWCRKKLATMESRGYTFPSSFRRHMTDAWGIDVSHWWLPDDEGFKPIVQAVREFVDGRANAAEDKGLQDLKELSGIFNALSLKTEESTSGASLETPQGGESNSLPVDTSSQTESIQALSQSDSLSSQELSHIPEGSNDPSSQ